MAGRGGKAPKRKGDALEVKMLADQVRMGRLAYRLRQAGGCVVDVVNVERCQDGHCTVHGGRVGHIRLIQAKSHRQAPRRRASGSYHRSRQGRRHSRSSLP